METNNILEFLLKFNQNCISINTPVNENDIERFEHEYKIKLPNDYKILLKQTNGFGLLGVEVFGLNCLRPDSLQQVYEYEHKLSDSKMPNSIVPFSPDGAGNHYCFDTNKQVPNSCIIVFWVRDYEYSDFDVPEVTHGSFAEWMNEVVIKWTLNHYDFSGNDL